MRQPVQGFLYMSRFNDDHETIRHTYSRLVFEDIHDRYRSNPLRNFVTFHSCLKWEYSTYDGMYDEYAIRIVELIKHGYDHDHYYGAISIINEVYTIYDVDDSYGDYITLVYRTIQR